MPRTNLIHKAIRIMYAAKVVLGRDMHVQHFNLLSEYQYTALVIQLIDKGLIDPEMKLTDKGENKGRMIFNKIANRTLQTD